MRQKPTRARKSSQDTSLPKYSIAVASDLSGVSQQQLRRLEDGGLVQPGRTTGNTRRYSDDDIEQIADISTLSDEGVNMAGIRHVLRLAAKIAALREENAELRAQLAASTGDAAPTSSAPSPLSDASDEPNVQPKASKARTTS